MNTRLRFLLSLLAATAAVVGTAGDVRGQDVAWAWVRPAGQGATFTPAPAFQFATSGGTITVDRDATQQNRFKVRMPGMAPATGIVHATAYGGNHVAVVNSWSAAGTAVIAWVELFDPSGAPANDAAFTIHYRQSGGQVSYNLYFWADQPTAASYVPTPTYRFGAVPTIDRLSTGRYRVTVSNFGYFGIGERGNVQVTPYATSLMHTKVESWYGSGTDLQIIVRCSGPGGAPTDGRFMLSYNEWAAPIDLEDGSGAHVWGDQPTAASYTPHADYTDSNGTQGPQGEERIDRLGTGSYRVHLPDLQPSGSATAQVTTTGLGGDYASIDSWSADGWGGTYVRVRTYAVSGAPVDAPFSLLYLTDRPGHVVAWARVEPAGKPNQFTPEPGLQYSSSGKTITVERDPNYANRFDVWFPGVTRGQGVVHISPLGGNHVGMVFHRVRIGGRFLVKVHLYGPGNTWAFDAPFLIYYRESGERSDRDAYVFANGFQAGTQVPNPEITWNGDRPDPSVTRLGTGEYDVRLPGLASTSGELGHVQVTSFTGGNRVRVVSWAHAGGDVTVRVRSVDSTGAPSDCSFYLSYQEQAAPIARREGSGSHVWAGSPSLASYTPAPAYTDSNGTLGPANAETIERLAAGVYRVHLPNVVPSADAAALVTPYGAAPVHAAVDEWGPRPGGGTVVEVHTFDVAGSPADAAFDLLYLTSWPEAGTPGSNHPLGAGCHGAQLTATTDPVIGASWNLELTGVPAGAVLGFVQLGLTSPVLSLGPQAPGCIQYTSGEAVRLLLLPIPSPAHAMAIPGSTAFLGVLLYAQGGAFVPGLNPLGLAASNGVLGVVGDR